MGDKLKVQTISSLRASLPYIAFLHILVGICHIEGKLTIIRDYSYLKGFSSNKKCIFSFTGVENGLIINHMVHARGADHRAAIVGPSVHNQRIERIWVDVFQGSLCVFYDLFQTMVNSGALDMSNDIQLFAFQYAFKPIIQRSLDRFRDAYNRHPLTSEGSRSPQQLFVAGMLEQQQRPTTGVREFWERAGDGADVNDFGIDDDGPVPELDRLTSEVRLDDLVCPVTDDVANELAESIDPVAMCNHDAAVDVYRAVLSFLIEKGY